MGATCSRVNSPAGRLTAPHLIDLKCQVLTLGFLSSAFGYVFVCNEFDFS